MQPLRYNSLHSDFGCLVPRVLLSGWTRGVADKCALQDWQWWHCVLCAQCGLHDNTKPDKLAVSSTVFFQYQLVGIEPCRAVSGYALNPELRKGWMIKCDEERCVLLLANFDRLIFRGVSSVDNRDALYWEVGDGIRHA